jgi:deoxyribodipyrimidine photo-lyase
MPAPPTRSGHDLASDFVRDQLLQRTVELNGKRHNPEGEYVLYWMQASQRLDENWAYRAAVRAADKFGRPLVVHQGLDPTYPHASDRHHAFIIQGARDTAHRADELGVHYQFVLRHRRDDDRRVVDRLAARAYLVVTDLYPTAGIRERNERVASRVTCRMIAVDSFCTVPSGLFPGVEYAARTIRPKIARVLTHSLEHVDDHPPQRDPHPQLISSLRDTTQSTTFDFSGDREAFDTRLQRELARCEINHAVGVVALRGGSAAAHARLQHFVDGDGLASYAERQNEASHPESTSGLSPYLHHGQIASAHVVRAALESGSPVDSVDRFVQQVTTWRELSFNWCIRTRDFDQLSALPEWLQRSMAEHVDDTRPARYDLETLERGQTGDALWNAAQRQLLDTGVIHNYPRMLWGKTLILWTKDYEHAVRWAFHLNDKWALDGRDPNSVGGIMWCFGLWDRPWGNKPVWGGIRPMVTSRARLKFDVDSYVRQWSAERPVPATSQQASLL